MRKNSHAQQSWECDRDMTLRGEAIQTFTGHATHQPVTHVQLYRRSRYVTCIKPP